MEYDVRWVQDDAELVRLHAVASSSWDPTAQCSIVTPCPTLEQLRTVARVYAAYVDDEPVAFVMCNVRRMVWLTGKPEHVAPACVAIAETIHREYVPAWGPINNPVVRAAIAAASSGRIEDDGKCCRWVG